MYAIKNWWTTSPRLLALSRSYATVVSKQRKEAPPLDPSRIYTARKTFLHEQYKHMLETSPAILILKHGNFSAPALSKIRRDLYAVTAAAPNITAPTPTPVLPGPRLKVIRPGVFSATVRSHFNAKTTASIREILVGPIAVLMFPTLNPPQLAKAVRLIDRAVPPRVDTPKPPRKPVGPDDIEDPEPPVKAPPTISLLGAIIDEQLFLVDGVKEIGKLPTLETLHAQIVGLLSAPGMTIARVLSQAGGGDVLRALQGFEKGLEMEQLAGSEPPKTETESPKAGL